MPVLLTSVAELPVGSHCLSFHASLDESADHAAEFLAGAPEGQAAAYWVADSALQSYYQDRLSEGAPDQVGCVMVLAGEHHHAADLARRSLGEPVLIVRLEGRVGCVMVL